MTTLISIGNSKGVRIPKAIIEQACLGGKELEFKVLDEGLLIRPVTQRRKGWQEKFDRLSETEAAPTESEKQWLDADLSDDGDWEW